VGEHDVAEIDRLLSGRRDIYDPRRRALFDKGQQQRAKQQPGEIIHHKAQLEPLGAGLAGTSGADAGIVDQDVEPNRRRPDRTGETTHLG
jgi:hypothetical protein